MIIHCDVTTINFISAGAFVVDGGDVQTRILHVDPSMQGTRLEMEFIIQILHEFPDGDLTINHDVLQWHQYLQGKVKLSQLPRRRIREAIGQRKVTFAYAPREKRSEHYRRCHNAARYAAKEEWKRQWDRDVDRLQFAKKRFKMIS